jgi:hypothetical protein
LPDYSVKDRSSGVSPDGEQGNDLTNIEQRYIEGRKSGLRETIVVGTESGIDIQSGVVLYGKVADRVSGEPLIGATIYIQELEKGAITDVDGRFSMVLRLMAVLAWCFVPVNTVLISTAWEWTKRSITWMCIREGI